MMKNKFFMLLMASSSFLFSMDSQIVRYRDIPFMTPEQLQNNLPVAPPELKADVDQWDQTNGGIIEEFTTLPSTVETFKAAVVRRNHYKKPHASPRDLGQWNHIFKSDKAIIRIPGLHNALGEQASNMGVDQANKAQLEAAGGYPAILHAEKPRQQGISRLLAARMLKQLNSPAIKTPDTWAYHIAGKPEELDDRNYVIIQDHFPNTLKPFDALSADQKKEVFKYLPLDHLYNAMKYTALWQFKGDDVYVNPANIQEIWLVDLEKPSNEGYDPLAAPGERGTPFRNVAVYGKDNHKWKFNIYENAFPQIRSWIQQHAPERVAEWDQLKSNDPDAS